ncbi:MAG TPA: MerR family transcriptional regulator [Kofleriaceae bacterium]|nr:MerR family transcriptional regulator [Kofleriaceae bacterium]
MSNAQTGLYSIAAAASASGLTVYAIRMWERRYAAVVPPRTAGRSRLYSQADVDRLTRLRRLTEAGHAIRHIAKLSDAELDQLLAATPQHDAVVPRFLQALQDYDVDAAEVLVMRAAALLGPRPFILQVAVPILEAIGERWRSGELRVYQEHTASALLRTALLGLLRTQTVRDPRLVAVVGTLTGEDHQLGALMAAVLVAVHGWRVVLLDHQAPARELCDAALQVGAAALLLSFIREQSSEIEAAIDELATALPPSVALLAGGRAAAGYVGHLKQAHFVSLDRLAATLDEIAARHTARR